MKIRKRQKLKQQEKTLRDSANHKKQQSKKKTRPTTTASRIPNRSINQQRTLPHKQNHKKKIRKNCKIVKIAQYKPHNTTLKT